MLRVFVSSTFRDLKEERKRLLDKLEYALTGVGMEISFVPDRDTSQEIGIKELRKSDVVIFLISPYYGSELLDECTIDGCTVEDCPLKNGPSPGQISYTHCEYKVALGEKKPHQTYLVDKGWDVVKELKDWENLDLNKAWDNPILKDCEKRDLKHFFEVAEQAWQFKEEVENEFCPRITDITDIETITKHLAANIEKWYAEGRINLPDFCGRRKELSELLQKMKGSIEVYGIGGVGKTTLIQVALLIQKLGGKKIVTVGRRQSYVTDSGYTHFKAKCREDMHEFFGDVISLEDIAEALSIPEEIRRAERDEKIRFISDMIDRENIGLFIDDFHLANADVKELVKNTRSIVLSSRRRTGIAKKELPLLGIEEKERERLINRIADDFGQKLSDETKDKIKKIAEGHPVATELMVRNYEKIDFDELKSYKLDLANSEHAEEFLRREVEEILSKDAFRLLQDIALLNTGLETNLDRTTLEKTYSAANFATIFSELLDTGMLKKREGEEGIYQFSYHHIQEALQDDNKERDKKAINYYKKKSEKFGKNPDDSVEVLLHLSKINPDKRVRSAFIALCGDLSPVHYGFKRLVDVGLILKSRSEYGEEEKAPIIGRIGNLYSGLKRFEAAETAYNAALLIYKDLADKNPDVYLPDVAMTQNNLGNLYSNLRRFEDAETAYNAALLIYKDLADKNPDVYLPYVATTQNNLGVLYRNLRRFEDAETAYNAALLIRKDLADKNPDVYLPDVAMTQNNLGNLYSNLRRFEDAETAYNAALLIYKDLADKNPDVYLPYVATTQNNLGVLYRDLRRFEDAETAYNAALLIRKDLADKNPDVYLPDVAMTQNNLGALYRDLRRFEDAETAYNAALLIRKDLADKNPDVYLPDVAMTQNNLGVLYSDLRRFEDAETASNAALLIYKDLADKNPDVYLPDVAMTQNNLGNLYSDLRRFEDAETASNAALLIYKDLADKNPDVYLPYVATTQNNLGALYHDLRRFEAAETAYNAALLIYKDLADKNSDVYLSVLLQVQVNIGGLYIDTKKTEEGIQVLKEVLKRRDVLPDFGAKVFANLGNANEDLQKPEDAVPNYLFASALYFILFRQGVPCLGDVVKYLEKVREFGEGEIKGDAELMLTTLLKLSGKEVTFPDVPISRRGKTLREALNGRESTFEPENEIDVMVLSLIADIKSQSEV